MPAADRRRRFRLSHLDLDRIDIVDVGANQGAEIVIAKGMPDAGDVHVSTTLDKKKRTKRVMRNARRRSRMFKSPEES